MDRPAIGMCFDRTFPASAVAEFARRLEDGGVDEMWFIEDCFFTTAPPLAAVALATTERLRVGLGILPAVARTAAVTAMEIATLASLGPGRVVAGIGHGVPSWMAQMGVAPESAVTTIEEVLVAVRALLRGDEVTTEGRTVRLDHVRLEHPPEPVPPVVAGVRGPRSLAVAGRRADGVLLDGPCPPAYVELARAEADAPAGWQVRCFAPICITGDRDESFRLVADHLGEMLADPHHRGLRALRHHDHLLDAWRSGGEEALAAAPAEWWGDVGLIGTFDDAVAYVRAMSALGVTSISAFPAPDLDMARSQLDDVVELVRRLDAD
jgi:alkanesulfonate monooxygenase SsuD/methylene tetrahydromethanopterin reductase-like flavin-dependent oxidoreductase (luciferase family)